MRVIDALVLKNKPLQHINKGGLDVMKCEKVQGMQELSQSDTTRIKDEKLKLQAVVADLSQVNRRWQRYNSDMQIYIKRLQATIEDQQEQLNNMADKRAERLFSQSSQENEVGDSGCKKCRPVIEFLRRRVSSLEDELSSLSPKEKLTCSFCSQQIQDSTTEKLSLQFRLEQACKHIDHLNRLMVSKGILKTGYNFLPEHRTCHMDEKLKSLDGLNFYECDSGSDCTATTSAEVDCKGVGKPQTLSSSNPPPAWEDTLVKSDPCFSPKGAGKDLNTASPTVCPGRCNKDLVNIYFTLDESGFEVKEKNPASTSTSMELDGDQTHSIKLPPDRNIGGVSCTSANNNSADKTKDDDRTSCKQSLNSSLLKSNHTELSNCSDSGSIEYNPPLSVCNFDQPALCKGSRLYQDNLVLGLSLNPPLFCPNCHTVFPPDSNVSYNKHISSCQLL